MKTKLIALALCTAAATTGLYAQQGTLTTAAQADQRTEVMVTELGLNTEQAAQVDVINARFDKSMTQLQSAGLDEQAMNTRASYLRDSRDKELKGALTPAQYEKMLTLRKEKKTEGQQLKQEKLQHTE